MAPSKPKAAYKTDQRQLSILIAASGIGGTTYSVTWRECQAGEERMRDHVVVKGRWPSTLNERWQALRALIWLAKAAWEAEQRPKS
jgi:hypothetical protein